MGKLLALIVGIITGLGVAAVAIGIVVSLIVVIGLGITTLARRDWVPVVYNARSLTVRKVSTLLTALGLALVVFVFATVLMLSTGIRRTLVSTGSDDNAKILRKGAQTEVQSGLLPDQVRLLSSAQEVAMGTDGRPLAAGESVVLIFALKAGAKSENEGSNVTIRGVGANAFELHPGVTIEGRSFRPGTSEIVVGKGLSGRFQGMRIGETTRFAQRDWTVVGILDGNGSGFDSEVWADVDQVLDAFNRRPSVSSVTLRLRDRAALSALQARVETDPQLAQLEIKRESDYYAAQSENFALFVQILGTFVAVIFAFGSALGAMITMYSQVAARTREIGCLRALGFRRRSVLVSFIIESVLLGFASGVVGLAGASFMRFASFSTMNFLSFSEVSFRFALTPTIAIESLLFAALMGYAGGLLPALRAARMPIVQATKGG